MSTTAAPVDEPLPSTALTRAAPTPLGTTHDDFVHMNTAHCESGVTASLLADAGHPIGEPMAFGVGGGLFFAHMPFAKIMGLPLTTFRSFPGTLFSSAAKRLGVRFTSESFRNADVGMARLDTLLDQGRRVGLQVNIFWLDYIPRQLRIHFNAHNLIVVERRQDAYLVSDPVVEELYECSADSLRRARFSGGAKVWGSGRLYYPDELPEQLELRGAVLGGLRQVCHRMLRIPRVVPWFGVQGIGHLAKQVERWPQTQGEERAREYLASVVRMQEEIGTGGAGFRYLFGAFLQQAAEQLAWPQLEDMAEPATQVGDHWRRWALHASRMARGKPSQDWPELAEGLRDMDSSERAFLEELDRVRTAGPPPRRVPQLPDPNASHHESNPG